MKTSQHLGDTNSYRGNLSSSTKKSVVYFFYKSLLIFCLSVALKHSELLLENVTLIFALQCQVGVLPLGTGNDLARVLGWGAIFDDDTQLSGVLERMEHAQIKMLDRFVVFSIHSVSVQCSSTAQQ